LEQGPPKARLEVDLCEIVAEAAAQRRPGPRARLELDLADEVRIACDPDQLERVFTNLIENAVRHTPPEGCVRIRVGVERRWAVAEVADNGSGIDPPALPHIFERFSRGRAHPPKGPGYGLGLAIVREIVLSHRGQITVDSEPGKGARFVVRLPLS